MADEPETPARTRETKAERLAKVHERAMCRFDAIWPDIGDATNPQGMLCLVGN